MNIFINIYIYICKNRGNLSCLTITSSEPCLVLRCASCFIYLCASTFPFPSCASAYCSVSGCYRGCKSIFSSILPCRGDTLDWQNSTSRWATFRPQVSTEDWKHSTGPPLAIKTDFTSIWGTPIANTTWWLVGALAGGGGVAGTWVVHQHFHQVAIQGCVSNELQQR